MAPARGNVRQSTSLIKSVTGVFPSENPQDSNRLGANPHTHTVPVRRTEAILGQVTESRQRPAACPHPSPQNFVNPLKDGANGQEKQKDVEAKCRRPACEAYPKKFREVVGGITSDSTKLVGGNSANELASRSEEFCRAANRRGRTGASNPASSNFLESLDPPDWRPADQIMVEQCARMMVVLGGARYIGIQDLGHRLKPLVLFSGSTGSTLAVRLDELSAEAVRKRIKQSEAEFLGEAS